MMVKYELKRIFTKRMNRLLLAVAVIISVVMSVFAVTSEWYVDSEGINHETPDAIRRLTQDKNQWKGELTGDVIAQIVADRQEIARDYPDDVPDTVYGERIQAYSDITQMVDTILGGDEGYSPGALQGITTDQAKDIYSIREQYIEQLIQKYGDTPEKQEFLRTQYEKTDTPFYYEPADSWDNMRLYATTYGIILVVLIGFLAAGIFADEFSLKADAVFFSSPNALARGAEPRRVLLPAGSGPRQLLRLDGERMLVVMENSGCVGLLCAAGESWELTSLLPATALAGENYPGGCCFVPGVGAFVANRGRDTVALFSVEGRSLVPAGEWPVGGRWPRWTAFSGGLLACACQKSGEVVFLRWRDGALRPAGRMPMASPSCILLDRLAIGGSL